MSASSIPKFRAHEHTTVGVLIVSPNSRLRLELRDKPLESDRSRKRR